MRVHTKTELAREIASAMVEDIQEQDPGREGIRALLARTENPSQALADMMIKDLERDVRSVPGPVLFPRLRRVMRDNVDWASARAKAGTGLGQFDWGSVITGVIGAAGGYLAATVKADAEKTIASMQITAQRQQVAQLAAQQQAAVSAGGAPIPAGGLPGWALPVGLTAGGLLLAYFMFMRKRR